MTKPFYYLHEALYMAKEHNVRFNVTIKEWEDVNRYTRENAGYYDILSIIHSYIEFGIEEYNQNTKFYVSNPEEIGLLQNPNKNYFLQPHYED